MYAWASPGLQPRERTEQAAGHADVRRLEPQVVVVVRTRAVALLALAVGEPPDRVQVRTLEQPDAVVERQPLAGIELVSIDNRGDGPQRRQPSNSNVTAHCNHPITIEAQCTRARAVELGHEDPLPLPEDHLAAADLQRQTVAEQHRAKMRIGIHAIAVRMYRDRCAPTRRRARPLARGTSDVGHSADLHFVDEHGTGRVRREDIDHALFDVAARTSAMTRSVRSMNLHPLDRSPP